MAEYNVRTANVYDDLTAVYPNGEWKINWNRDNVMVFVEENAVIGAVIFWDSGHPVIYAAHLSVLEGHRQEYVAYRLLEGLEEWCIAHTKVACIWTAKDERWIEGAKRFGARVESGNYTLLTQVIPCQD